MANRREVVRGLSAIGATSLVDGCGGRAVISGSTNPQPVPVGLLTPASVWVSRAKIGAIGPSFAGLSYEKSSMTVSRFTPENVDLVVMFRDLGPSVLRLGGESVDRTQWTPVGGGRTAGQVAPADIDALAGFLQLSGWSVLYGVNLATSTPAAAAGEVTYAAQTLGDSLRGIEFGNQCDMYQDRYFKSWTLHDFERRWERFRNAVFEVQPNIPIAGPASAAHVESWTLPFGQDVSAAQIALLTQHYYRGSGQSATEAELISPDANLVQELATLKAGAAVIGVPFRITETNSFYGRGAGDVSDSYASALWVIDHLFNIALGGAIGVNLHGGGERAYTPIADIDGSVVEARPEYYGILLFTRVGQGTLLEATVVGSGLNITAYAVRSITGALNIVVVNKETARHLSLSLHCGDTVNSAELLLLTGPSLAAKDGGALIQGAAVPKDGSFSPAAAYTLKRSGSTVSCYLPAMSAGLIRAS